MGYKYFVEARLNGFCSVNQANKSCKTLIGFLITLIIYRMKYPIVDAGIRNGYRDCKKCNLGEWKPLCYDDVKEKVE